MKTDIERLLRLAADYDGFCRMTSAAFQTPDSNELGEEELDLVAAAAGLTAEQARQEVHESLIFK